MQQQMSMQKQVMAQQQQVAEAEQMLKHLMSQILEPKARERLSNLKMVKPELAMQLELYLAQLAQSGQLQSKLSDDQIVLILRKLSEKKEINITKETENYIRDHPSIKDCLKKGLINYSSLSRKIGDEKKKQQR